MLINRISKLFLSFVVLTFLTSQFLHKVTVHASSNLIEQLSTRTSVEITNNSTDKDFIDAIANENVSKIVISGQAKITDEFLTKLKMRSNPLEIVIGKEGSLSVDKNLGGGVGSFVIGGGNIGNIGYKLTITRGEGKTGELITFENPNMNNIELKFQNIKFDNGESTDNIIGNSSSNVKFENVTSNGNLNSENRIDVSSSSFISQDSITVEGSVEFSSNINNTFTSGEISFTLKGEQGNIISTTNQSVTVNSANYSFSEGNLSGGHKYILVLELTSTDNSKNTVKISTIIEFKTLPITLNFGVEVPTTTDTTANFKITTVANLNQYPLKIMATSENSINETELGKIENENIKEFTARNLSPSTKYTYKILDNTNNEISLGTFETFGTSILSRTENTAKIIIDLGTNVGYKKPLKVTFPNSNLSDVEIIETTGSVNINLPNISTSAYDYNLIDSDGNVILVGKIPVYNIYLSDFDIEVLTTTDTTANFNIVNEASSNKYPLSVMIAKKGSSTYNEMGTILDSKVTTFTVRGLSPNTTYDYKILDTYGIEIDTGTFKTFDLKVLNRNSSTANLSLYFGTDAGYKYPLKLEFSNNSFLNISINKTYKDSMEIFLNNLSSNLSYPYKLMDSEGREILTGTIPNYTLPSSNITGTGSSSNGNFITSSDIINSDIRDVTALIHLGSTNIQDKLRNKDLTTNIEGVTAYLEGSKLRLNGLVPTKEYKNLIIIYTDENGIKQSVTVPSFKTKDAETKLRQFILDVYRQSMERLAEEKGFAYWENALKNKYITPEKFILNLLNEKEFNERCTTSEMKMEYLYRVIVNRSSDFAGLSFWSEIYNEFILQDIESSLAVLYVANSMLNEIEFIERVNNLDI